MERPEGRESDGVKCHLLWRSVFDSSDVWVVSRAERVLKPKTSLAAIVSLEKTYVMQDECGTDIAWGN
jgi:hypothetical protein